MVFRGSLASRPAMLSVKDTSVSLAFEAEWVAAWDFGGRLYSLWKHGETYRRGLSGRLLFKPGPSADERRRAPLEGAAADAILRETAEQAGLLERSLERDPRAWATAGGHHPSGEVTAIVRRCARFDSEAARRDSARFAEVYSPIGILPPDQYLSTVLQATDGCSFGTCTFCDLYHGGYRVKTPDEFRRHVEAVREYLGESALLRGRSFFLGSANALAVPMPRLLEFFDSMPGPFGDAARPINAFVDGFTGTRKSAADYAELRRRGLGRVYVGLESGHDPLLAFVRKPATREQAIETVRAIKAGGATVGVVVMIGLGGRVFADGHVRDTVSALGEMGLGAGDLLFFSELVEVPGTAYPQAAAAADVVPLPPAERAAQAEAIRTGLRFAGPPPQLAKYDVREFIY